MSQNLAEIVDPLVEKGLFENAEIVVKNLMVEYLIHQIDHYRAIIQKFEKKYGMSYIQFNNYLKERAKRIPADKSIHKKFMLEEEDCLDWKIATELLESWLGLKKESTK